MYNIFQIRVRCVFPFIPSYSIPNSDQTKPEYRTESRGRAVNCLARSSTERNVYTEGYDDGSFPHRMSQSICRLTVWYTAPSIVDRQSPLHYPTKLTREKKIFLCFPKNPSFIFLIRPISLSIALVLCFLVLIGSEGLRGGKRERENGRSPSVAEGKSFCRLPMPRQATQSCFALSLLSEVSLKVLSLSRAFIPLLFTQVMGLYFRRTALRRLPSGTPPLLPHLFLLSFNHIPFVLPFSGFCLCSGVLGVYRRK